MRLTGENHKQVYIALGLTSRSLLTPLDFGVSDPRKRRADARIRTADPFITSGYRCARAFTPRD